MDPIVEIGRASFTSERNFPEMTQRLQVESCGHCEAIGVFGPSGELACRNCSRVQVRPDRSGYSNGEGYSRGPLDHAVFTQMWRDEQGPQAQRNAWQLAASVLAVFVALALIALAFVGVIPTAALLLAVALGALALSLARVI